MKPATAAEAVRQLQVAKQENDTLRKIVKDLHWMARRYADGRQTYAPHTLNEHTETLLGLGVELNPTGDDRLFAREG